MEQSSTDNETDKEAIMAGAHGPEQLVTGICEKIIGLKVDPFGNAADLSDDSPALEGK